MGLIGLSQVQKTWAQRLKMNDSKTMLNGKFCVEQQLTMFSKNYIVFFVPRFQVYTGSAPGDSNMNVVVSYGRMAQHYQKLIQRL